MKKRGQIQGEVIKYILIALAIIMIQIIGYKFYTTVKEKQCQTELAKFEIDLKNLDKSIEFGAVNERTYDAPCNVDKIYFIDLDKDIPLEIFNKLPIIKDSLKSKVKENIFLVKDNKLVKSFYAGNLEFGYPYHTCLMPRSSKINFFLEGAGVKVKIIPGCTQPECTDIPINISEEEAKLILAEFIDFACGSCPTSIETEMQNLNETLKKINLFRRITYCKETGITTVKIILKPKKGVELENFRFFEFIPKECIEDLNNYLAETIQGDFNVFIEADPLIMWQLDEVDYETMLSYKLKTELTEECKKIIEGLGIAEEILETAAPSPPVISDFPEQIEFNEDSVYRDISFNLDNFVEDPDNSDSELIWSYDGNSNIIVTITESREVTFEPEENWFGSKQIRFRVTDPDGLSDSHRTRVKVLSVDDTPVIEGLPDQTFDGEPPKEYTNLFKLSDYAYDVDGDSLDYEIISQTNPELVECSLYGAFSKKVKCKVNKNEDGFSDITVQVSDGSLTDTDTFRVNIQYVGEGEEGEDEEECDHWWDCGLGCICHKHKCKGFC